MMLYRQRTRNLCVSTCSFWGLAEKNTLSLRVRYVILTLTIRYL